MQQEKMNVISFFKDKSEEIEWRNICEMLKDLVEKYKMDKKLCAIFVYNTWWLSKQANELKYYYPGLINLMPPINRLSAAYLERKKMLYEDCKPFFEKLLAFNFNKPELLDPILRNDKYTDVKRRVAGEFILHSKLLIDF